MASTFTDLGLELMATGENAGTWGTKTNANLSLAEQLLGGYNSQAVTDSGTPTALTIAEGALTGTAQHRVIELTGSISGNRIVTFPLLTENFYIIKNSTSGAYTVQLKAVSGSGATVTFSATEKTTKVIYLDGVATNTGVFDTGLNVPGGATTQIQYNNAGSFGGDADLVWTAGTGLIINSQKELRLADADDSAYVGLKSAATVSGSYTLTLPAATGSANQILTTNGSGVLSFADNSGGTSWVAVKTSGFTAVAGEGYFCNTTSAGFTVALPAGTLGDEVSLVDYAGTFDTNNLTVAPNGSEKIQGVAASLTVSIERAGLTLVYTDSTQGWLLKDK